jgi:hypothetical protein
VAGRAAHAGIRHGAAVPYTPRMKKMFAVARTAAEFAEQLADGDFEAIALATPAAEHAEQAIAILERGIAVFCGKPLAIDAHETQLVVDVARGNCKLLGVELPWRESNAVKSFMTKVANKTFTDVAVDVDDARLYDAIDLALSILRFPRIEKIDGRRVHVAGGAKISFTRRSTEGIEASFRGPEGTEMLGHIDGVTFLEALDAWVLLLMKSTEFDAAIETINDVARVYDALK